MQEQVSGFVNGRRSDDLTRLSEITVEEEKSKLKAPVYGSEHLNSCAHTCLKCELLAVKLHFQKHSRLLKPQHIPSYFNHWFADTVRVVLVFGVDVNSLYCRVERKCISFLHLYDEYKYIIRSQLAKFGMKWLISGLQR